MTTTAARTTPTPGMNNARSNRFMTVEEQVFCVYNNQGIPYLHTDVGSDGNGLTTPQQWLDHMPDGQNVSEGRALVGEEGLITRPFLARYRLMEILMRATCGDPVSDTTIDGGTRRKVQWLFPEYGAPPIYTRTGFYGFGTHGTQLFGGKIIAFNLDTMRNADGGSVTGNITWQFNYYQRPVAMPGAQVRSETKRITATNAAGTGVFAIPHPTNPALPTTNINVTPGMSAAALRTAIIAITGYTLAEGATVAVTGTTNALTAGLTDPGVAPTLTIVGGAGSIASGTYAVLYTWTNALGETNVSPLANAVVGASTSSIQGTAPTLLAGATGTKWYMAIAPGSNIYALVATSATNTATWTTPPAGGAQAAPGSNTTAPANNFSNGFYDIAFGGTLANTNIANWPSGGGNGWTQTTTVDGSNGTGPVILGGSYLLPQHCRLYLATGDTDLATIDMNNMPNSNGVGGDPHLLATAPGATFGMSNLWALFYPLNGQTHATDFVAGAQNVALGITLPKDDSPGSDWTYFMDTMKQGSTAPGFWLCRRWRAADTGEEWWEDAYVGRSETTGFEATNDVSANTIPLGRLRNPGGTGSLWFTLILPVP